MDFTINIDALDLTQAVVNSASDRTPVSDFELLVVGNRLPLTIRFCDDDGATPAFVTDGTVSVDIGLGLPEVDGSLDYATYAGLAVSGSTRVGTLDLDGAELRGAVYRSITGIAYNQRIAQAPFVLEVRTTTAAGLVQSRCLQRVYVTFRVMPLTPGTNPDPGDAGRVPSGGTAGYVLTKVSGTDYDYNWLSPSAASLPPQTGNAGKFLTTDGTNASWATVSGGGGGTWGSITGTLSDQTDLQTALNAKQNSLTIGNLTEATSSVLTISGGTGAIIGSGLTIQVKQASGSQAGYLASADWTTFNNKQAAITFGTGVLDALGVNIGLAGAPVLFNGALGTPSSGTLTNCTFPTLNQNTTGSAASLSISGQTGLLTVTGLASTNRVKTVRDAADTILELGGSYTPTGTWTSLTMVTPVLGTPASGTLTNCTGLPVASGISGLGTGVAAALAVNVGSAGAFVTFNGALGTPSSGTVTNLTGTASININGTVGATTRNTGAFTTVRTNNGTVAAPAYGWVGETDTGFSLPSSNQIAIGIGGTEYARFTTAGFQPTFGLNNATAYAINARKSRGTVASPTVITTGDDLLAISGFGYVGSTGTYVEAARMLFDSAGTIADNSTGCGGTVSFQTRIVGGSLTERLGIDVAGNVTVAAALELGHASDTTLSRSSAGVLAVEGVVIPTISSTNTLTNKTIQLAENAPIILDAALSADGTYCGITEAGTAGATLAFGDVVYLAAADSRWELTDADAESTAGPVKIGICVLAAAADGDPTTILLYGKVRADAAFPTFTVSAPVYLGTTAGDLQTSQPSGTDDVIRIAGYGNTGDELFFCPDPSYMTHT